ncbi:MAG TPA: Rrf2 family transcriptional regulator [Bacteroidota bacterium]|nr:Rrf2 family transcriptional regulator [Bacteroidota bacterium]
MVRLSKKVEYGLIAIRHIATKPVGEIVTAKEIADIYGIPYELLSKVLQKLTKSGLISSHQGVHGGYAMAKNPSELPVSMIINAIEGVSPAIAQCFASGPESCTVFTVCTIKSPLTKVQENIERAFSSMTLAEIV